MNSKKKGNRFELKVAKLFSKAFKRKIRRTPLSGGHEIKSDIYDPNNDNFPYFVECKHHDDFKFNSLITGCSDLFKYYIKAAKEAKLSIQSKKYNKALMILIVFRGGHFKTDMVMYHNLASAIASYQGELKIVMQVGEFNFLTLEDFLKRCNTEPLK